ncbi:MAG: hypothetical protein LUF33_01465 [Clostridiales bacterium]|nr:hypothetical protein [Clostridiales bacterium]
MPKYKIAELIVEYAPKYDKLKRLSKPFEYNGGGRADFAMQMTDKYFNMLSRKMNSAVDPGGVEEYAYASIFAAKAVKFHAVLLHSSAIIYGGRAYLFSAASGVGKSTHTRLWIEAFGSDNVRIINDDKPVIRLAQDGARVYGTPFDGGSGIALNESAPLGGIAFVRRGEENSIRPADTGEIVAGLYHGTTYPNCEQGASDMLKNFDDLIACSRFYILTCNTDPSAALLARDAMVRG